MIATAVVFDIISIIPVVGEAIGIVGSAVVFGIWFLTLGIPLLSTKKLVTTFVGYLGEAIPAVSALPFITVGVILIIGMTRLEDKTGISVEKLATGKISSVSDAVGALRGAAQSAPAPAPRMDDILPSSA